VEQPAEPGVLQPGRTVEFTRDAGHTGYGTGDQSEHQASLPDVSGTLAQMLLPFPQYSGLNDRYDNIVNSNYNALQLVVRQRMSHGLQFMFNYAWGAAIDDDCTFLSVYLSNRIEHSRSTVDSPNVVNATAI
jgi:hypothetical protein